MPTEDLILELIEDQLRGAILIRTDLVEDHLLLLRPLLLGEGAPTYDIEEALQSPMSEATRQSDVEDRLLLGRIGIHLCAHSL